MSLAVLEEVMNQDPGFQEVRAVLREVGTGVRQSRHVKGEILGPAVRRILAGEVHVATAAAFLTAYTIFPPNDEERMILAPFLDAGLATNRDVGGALIRLGYPVGPHPLWDVHRRLLHGAGHLSVSEIDTLVDGWFEGSVEDALTVSILLVLRMTEERTEENRAFLLALRRHARITTLSVPLLIDLADPTDGFTRTLVPTPLVAALLATLGIPTVMHGLPGSPSKWGVTHEDLLGRLGYPFPRTIEEVGERITQGGWAYITQSLFFSDLAAKLPARARMVKRSVINTVEKLLLPVRARSGDTRLLTGYVHKGYDDKILSIERVSSRCAVVRGEEGSIAPRPGQTGGRLRIGEGEPVPFTFIAHSHLKIPEMEGPETGAALLRRAMEDPEGEGGQFVVEAALLVMTALGLCDDMAAARREATRALSSVRIGV